MMFRYLRLGLVVGISLASLPSCGIISSDVTDVELALPGERRPGAGDQLLGAAHGVQHRGRDGLRERLPGHVQRGQDL